MNIQGKTLLLIEDNEDDVFIFKRAYRQAQLEHPLQVVQDGEEATEYLLGTGRFADQTTYPRPAMIFLDLKLPLKSGLEILQLVRDDPALANLCVVVLTSSAEERDVSRAAELRAQTYLVKPPTAKTLCEVMGLVEAYLTGVPADVLPRIPGDKFEREPAAGEGS